MTHSVPPDRQHRSPRPLAWHVYQELGGIVLSARIAGESPFDAVRRRWPNMEPARVRPFVQWLQERGMVEEIDIWRTAKVLTDSEGDRAVFYAAQRADSLLDHGDLEGAALWRRIKSSIEELLNLEPPKRKDA